MPLSEPSGIKVYETCVLAQEQTPKLSHGVRASIMSFPHRGSASGLAARIVDECQ